MDKEMQRALELDGEKLRQLTGEDHGPFPFEVARRCDNCLHMVLETERSHDAPPESVMVCGLHIVAGGWRRMRVAPEAVCSDHEFDDLSDRAPAEPQYPSSDWPRF